jgi:curved DNA-binding protein CbpA
MVIKSNYDILELPDGSSKKEIQEAFRKLALQHHTDKGGDPEKFKEIKQAYEDLKIGKKYPDTDKEKHQKSKIYSGDDEEEIRRRNRILAKEVFQEIKIAEEWLRALNRTNTTGIRLFGSKALGEMEFERKQNGSLFIKGNLMAGSLCYDGPITMQGNINSPTFGEEYYTNITLTKGDFKFLNPLENKYKIDNGAKITAENGDIVVGNVFGNKIKTQDPTGKVGIFNIDEKRTHLLAPHGKIIVENAVNTVSLDGDVIIMLNAEDDVKITGNQILIYGNKVTYDVEINLKQDGVLRFFEKHSVQGLSDDSKVKLENGKSFRLQELKTKKIRDISSELISGDEYNHLSDDATMVGNGFTITYDMLDNFDKKPKKKQNNTWFSKLRSNK